jgi:hypothetical protein
MIPPYLRSVHIEMFVFDNCDEKVSVNNLQCYTKQINRINDNKRQRPFYVKQLSRLLNDNFEKDAIFNLILYIEARI